MKTLYSLLSVDSFVCGILWERGTGEQHGERHMEISEVCECEHSIITAEQFFSDSFWAFVFVVFRPDFWLWPLRVDIMSVVMTQFTL